DLTITETHKSEEDSTMTEIHTSEENSAMTEMHKSEEDSTTSDYYESKLTECPKEKGIECDDKSEEDCNSYDNQKDKECDGKSDEDCNSSKNKYDVSDNSEDYEAIAEMHKTEEDSKMTEIHKTEEDSTMTEILKSEDSTITEMHRSEDSAMTEMHKSEDSAMTEMHKSEDSTLIEMHKSEEGSTLIEMHKSEEDSTLTETHKSEEDSTMTEIHTSEENSTMTEMLKSEEDSTMAEMHKTEEDSKMTEIHKTEDDSKMTEIHKTEEDSKMIEVHKIEDSTMAERLKTEENSTMDEMLKTEENSTMAEMLKTEHQSMDNSMVFTDYSSVPPPSSLTSASGPVEFSDAMAKVKAIAAKLLQTVAQQGVKRSHDDSYNSHGLRDIRDDYRDDYRRDTYIRRDRGSRYEDYGRDSKRTAYDGGLSRPEHENNNRHRYGIGNDDRRSYHASHYGPLGDSSRISTQEEFKVPNAVVGLVIGRGGENLKRIEKQTGARVQFSQDQPPDVIERRVTITGTADDVKNAKGMIQQLVDDAINGNTLNRRDLQSGGGNRSTITIHIPSSKVGVVIGRGGETIRDLQDRSGARINVTPDSAASPQSNDRSVTLIGDEAAVQRAKALIDEI
ncbi:3285_t:CDS:2, partial [Scutellospora calospora]